MLSVLFSYNIQGIEEYNDDGDGYDPAQENKIDAWGHSRSLISGFGNEPSCKHGHGECAKRYEEIGDKVVGIVEHVLPHDGEPVGMSRHRQNAQRIDNHQYQSDNDHTLMYIFNF